jgi:hypothetical protein
MEILITEYLEKLTRHTCLVVSLFADGNRSHPKKIHINLNCGKSHVTHMCFTYEHMNNM